MSYFKNCQSLLFVKPGSSLLSALISANSSKLQLIYKHPFNRKLFAGTLDQSAFGRYLRDDFLYLHEFASAINMIAKRTNEINPDLSTQLKCLSNDIICNEQSMQLKYAEHFTHLREHKMGIAVSEYSKYLIDASMHSEISESLCSILPCFWIYYQLGILARDTKSVSLNPYYDWIATYSSPEFVKVTKDLATAINLMGSQTNQENYTNMNLFFSRSVTFELNFFNEVYPDQLDENHGINIADVCSSFYKAL